MTTNRKFSSTLEALASLSLGGNSSDPGHSQPVPAAPALDRVLSEIGPLPPQALFLGIASDGLPVLLNLFDPHPGPMLVIGDHGAGKTAFLKAIAHSLSLTHTESEIQYGVITTRSEEWEQGAKPDHCIGIFDVTQAGAREFVQSLASWAHGNRNSTQSILILLENLDATVNMEPEALNHFRWLLLRGPARRVWPIITLEAERYGQVLAWLENFRTRVFGRVADLQVAQALGGDQAAALDQLAVGTQFSLRENGSWLKFWLPSF
jgi:hypothetical protein